MGAPHQVYDPRIVRLYVSAMVAGHLYLLRLCGDINTVAQAVYSYSRTMFEPGYRRPDYIRGLKPWPELLESVDPLMAPGGVLNRLLLAQDNILARMDGRLPWSSEECMWAVQGISGSNSWAQPTIEIARVLGVELRGLPFEAGRRGLEAVDGIARRHAALKAR